MFDFWHIRNYQTSEGKFGYLFYGGVGMSLLRRLLCRVLPLAT